jgi:hypothetical protein
VVHIPEAFLRRGLRRLPAPFLLIGESLFADAERLLRFDTWFGQPGCFFRRSLYERAGGTVSSHLRYAMDLDLWLRLGRLAPLLPIPAELGAYRLHDESKTVAQRAPMETEVVQVLLEHLGPGAALERVRLLAEERFALETRYRRLTEDLSSPLGWGRILRRRIHQP